MEKFTTICKTCEPLQAAYEVERVTYCRHQADGSTGDLAYATAAYGYYATPKRLSR